jgi:hypothetical protein
METRKARSFPGKVALFLLLSIYRIQQGRSKRRPYGVKNVLDHHDPVKMVRHDHEFIQGNLQKSRRQTQPYPLDHFPSIIQLHHPVHYVAKQAFPPMDADRDEVRRRGRIVIFPQTDRTPAVDIGIVSHAHSPLIVRLS